MTQILNEANYYSDHKYMSVSAFKSLKKCPAAYMAYIRGEIPKDESESLLLGSLVDEMLTGDEDSQKKFFEENNDKLFKKNGEPYAKVAQALETIDLVKAQPLMMHYLDGEHQKIMTGEIEGVPVKIKMDSYKPGEFIADLKYMKSMQSPNLFESMVSYWGYDIQAAVYQEIVYQNTGERLPFYFVVATKESPPHLDVGVMEQADLDEALDGFKKRVKELYLILAGDSPAPRCEQYSCKYCTQTRVLEKPIYVSQFGMERNDLTE